jgi:hypothetical protein
LVLIWSMVQLEEKPHKMGTFRSSSEFFLCSRALPICNRMLPRRPFLNARIVAFTDQGSLEMSFFEVPNASFSTARREQRLVQEANFPNQVSAGSFTPHSTIVEVGCFRTKAVQDALKAHDLMPVRKDIQVLCHEMTHWFDFFGTVWGRNYIGAICRGYRALERRTETEFPNILNLFDQDRRVLSPEYYRFTRAPSATHTKARPWAIDYVAGAEIDPDGRTREDMPIFMARFGENPSRLNFARQPVSVGALLEVRAIASEVGAAIAAVNSHPNPDDRLVEMHIVNREFNDLAYDHDLIEYNTAAHILSIQSGSQELFLSCRLAAALAFVALNMKGSDFEKLKVPEAFAEFGKRNKAFKKRHDRGYAFVSMVFNGGRFEGDEVEYIERCVSSSNLGSAPGLLERAAEELNNPYWFSKGSEVTAHFFRETAMSRKILETLSETPQHTITLQTLMSDFRTVCPPFLDADANFVELNEGRLEEYRPEALHDAAHELRAYTRNLLTGCRGI